MERKRLSPLDEYVMTLNETPDLVNRRVQFYNDLRHFYRRRWGCPMKVPTIHGVDVDLFRLYEAVINLGGWHKVSNAEKWTEVLREIGFDEDIQVAEYGIKMIYMRYLSKFEQAEFGNENDDHENELLTTRGRLKNMALVAYAEAPVSMPRSGSTDSDEPDYHKLLHSLLSGLPNEVDFALNICTVMSHPGPYLLRLAECPQMLTVFAAHCGVFADGVNALSDLHLNSWRHQSGHDFGAFWRNADIKDEEVCAMIAPILNDMSAPVVEGLSYQKRADKMAKITHKFFASDNSFDLKNTTNWRVFQILSICRNLSFEECNRAAMAANVPFLKLLVACCHSQKYQIISNNALETLSNIASEIDLNAEGSVFEGFLVLKTVARCLFSNDKFEVLRSLEILTGLCNTKNNEAMLCEFMNERVIARIFALITAKDISVCLFTLESLYQWSEMGRSPCELIGRHDRAVDILVDLATTDAASFGVAGLAGIKVVEINCLTGQTQPYQPPRQQSQSMHNAVASAGKPQFLNNAAFARSLGPSPAVPQRQFVPRHPSESHYSNYAPIQPSPLVTSQPRPLSTFSSAVVPMGSPLPSISNHPVGTPATPTPVVYQYTPTATTPVAQPELRVKTPGPSAMTNVPSVTTPTQSKPLQISTLTTPSTTRGKRFSSGLRSALRSKDKASTKAASMRAVQEVVAAMSTSVNRKATTDEEDAAVSEKFASGESRLEQLTKSWIREHCALVDGAVANRGEMYAAYVEHIQSTKNANGEMQMLAGGMQMFINQLKAIFPSVVITHSPGSTIHAVEGISFHKDGVHSDTATKALKSSDTATSDLLITAQTTSPTACKTEPSNSADIAEKKSLSNGFIHDDPLNRPLHNGNDEAAKLNGVPTTKKDNDSDEKKARNNNNNDGEQQTKENNGSTSKNSSDKNGGTNGVSDENAPLKIETANSANHSEEKDPSALGDADKKAVTDALSVDTSPTQEKRPKGKTSNNNGEDGEVSTIGALLKSTYNGQVPLPTSGRRGKRRTTTNGHPRGFTKRAKLQPNSPKPQASENNNDGLANGTQVAAVMVVGQPVPMAEATASTSTGVPPPPVVAVRPVVIPELMCEWDCCGRLFTTADAVLFHNTTNHLGADSASSSATTSAVEKFICRWPGCDSIPRSKWSITTHLQDHHCTDHSLQMALRKRLEMGAENYMAWIRQRIAEPSAANDTSAVYSRFSALDAIRRHAMVGIPNEITDDSEGPVTRSMRLTSCLVLRNIAKHSVEGRRKIRKYESHLCRLALSKMESNVVLAQALAELNTHSIVPSSSTEGVPAATIPASRTLLNTALTESVSETGDSDPATPATPM